MRPQRGQRMDLGVAHRTGSRPVDCAGRSPVTGSGVSTFHKAGYSSERREPGRALPSRDAGGTRVAPRAGSWPSSLSRDGGFLIPGAGPGPGTDRKRAAAMIQQALIRLLDQIADRWTRPRRSWTRSWRARPRPAQIGGLPDRPAAERAKPKTRWPGSPRPCAPTPYHVPVPRRARCWWTPAAPAATGGTPSTSRPRRRSWRRARGSRSPSTATAP